MRIHRILVLALLLSIPLVAFADERVRVDVVAEDGARIVLDYAIPTHGERTVSIDGASFQRLWLSGEPVSLVKGAPALPYVTRSLAIPGDARMEVRVLSVDYRDVAARVAPSKGNLPRTVDPSQVPYEFGPVYEQDAFWPPSVAELGDPYRIRDRRGIVLRVNPLQYNPVRQVLRVYKSITVEVVAAGPGKINVVHPDDRAGRVGAFEEIYRTHFVNAAGGPDYPSPDEQGDLLIIAHDAWIANLDPLVAHKSSSGIPTTVVGVSTIGNDPASIKSYIQQVYDTSDLAFVLLVGDAAQVATQARQVGYENGASDAYYSKLAGTDNYPDILVGRFSAGTAAEVDTQVARTVDYETTPATAQPWFRRGTGIASAEGAGIGDEGQSDRQHEDEIRSWLMADGYDPVDQIYDPGATDTQVAGALNAGRGVVNYTGHGSATSWGTTGFNVADVDALVNDDMLPFVFSVACNNGEFHHYGKCFAEAWLRATNAAASTGAVAMYASSVQQAWAPPMEAQDEFNLRLTDPTRPYSTFGALCYAGSGSMMDAYGTSGVEMFDTWVLFGDPSLRMVPGAAPTHGLDVLPADGFHGSADVGGACSPARTDYTLHNHGDFPIDFAVVPDCPWLSASVTGGTIPAHGSVGVTVSFTDDARNLDCGHHAGSVDFVNTTDHDGDATREVTLDVGSLLTVGDWPLDADPGWSIEGEWEYGVPAGSGGGHGLNPDPVAGASGTEVYGVNLGGNFDKKPGGPYYLTLGPLDLAGVEQVSVTFRRWLNSVGPPQVVSTVEASGDGLGWTTVWSAADVVADAAWTPQTLDLSAIADDGSAVYVRWGYAVTDRGPYVGSGWNVDDVILEGMPHTARILLSVEPGRLSWEPSPGASGYDVVRGDLDLLRSSGGDFAIATETCLADDLPDAGLDETDTPVVGGGYWFLVRGVWLSGPMSYQSLGPGQVGWRDDEIVAAAGSCP